MTPHLSLDVDDDTAKEDLELSRQGTDDDLSNEVCPLCLLLSFVVWSLDHIEDLYPQFQIRGNSTRQKTCWRLQFSVLILHPFHRAYSGTTWFEQLCSMFCKSVLSWYACSQLQGTTPDVNFEEV